MKQYLIIYDDSNTLIEAGGLKELMQKFAKYDGISDSFYKALEGFCEEDVNGIIDLFRRYTWTSIKDIFEIKEHLYSLYGGNNINE